MSLPESNARQGVYHPTQLRTRRAGRTGWSCRFRLADQHDERAVTFRRGIKCCLELAQLTLAAHE